MNGKLIVGALSLLLIAAPTFAKDGRIKMSSFCEYKGNVENKMAVGSGSLSISNPLIKGAVDVISGTFEPSENGYVVKNATLDFYSGWRFEGELMFTVEKGDSKRSSVCISLTNGEMSAPTLSESVIIGEEPVVFSRNYSKSEKTYSLDDLVLKGRKTFMHKGDFSKYSKCDSITCDYSLPIKEDNGTWFFKYNPMIVSPLLFTNGCTCELSGNDWSCTTPAGDTVSFVKGKYHAFRRQNDAYLHYVEESGSVYTSSTGEYRGTLELPASLETFMSHSFAESDLKFMNGVQMGNDSSRVIYSNGAISQFSKKYADGNIEYNGTQGIITMNDSNAGFNGNVTFSEPVTGILKQDSISKIKFSPVGGTRILENGNLVYYKEHKIIGFNKHFGEAVIDIREGTGIVNYFDGGSYEGTMKVWSDVDETGIVAWNSINDISLEYIDGVETHPNGSSDVWKNSLTEYLKNKEAGNYAKFESAMEGLNKAKVAALAKKWDEARPSLENEWGSRIVNAFYEGRFILGTPRGFVQRLKELGLPLMRVVGPMKVDGIYNDYIVVIADRVTGESKTSYILRFGGLFDELLSINK